MLINGWRKYYAIHEHTHTHTDKTAKHKRTHIHTEPEHEHINIHLDNNFVQAKRSQTKRNETRRKKKVHHHSSTFTVILILYEANGYLLRTFICISIFVAKKDGKEMLFNSLNQMENAHFACIHVHSTRWEREREYAHTLRRTLAEWSEHWSKLAHSNHSLHTQQCIKIFRFNIRLSIHKFWLQTPTPISLLLSLPYRTVCVCECGSSIVWCTRAILGKK